MSETNIYKVRTLKSLHFTVGFFILIFVFTFGLYFYGTLLDKKNTQITEQIKELEASIEQKEKNKDIIIYNLYNLNKEPLKRLEYYSQVVKFINHLEEIKQRYDILFEGFNYQNGILSTRAISKSNEQGLDFQKTVNFIKFYRKQKDALFDLGFINTVMVLQDKEKFNVLFKLKDF